MNRTLRHSLSLALAIIACFSQAGLAANAQITESADTAASVPARPTSSIVPLPPATTVAQGLVLTDDEKTILAAIRDHSQQLDEQGLFVLLSRALALPQLDRQEFDKIETAPIDQMLIDPAKLRCKPIRLRLRVFNAEKWMPGQEIGVSRRWMAARPVWYLTGLDNTGNAPSKKPVIVLSAVDPSAILGRPQRIGGAGEMLYPSGQNIELAGLFYKVFTGPSIDAQKATSQGQLAVTSDYPVIVGWQIMQPSPLISDESKEIAGIILAGLALCASYIYVRRRTSQAASRRGELRIRQIVSQSQASQDAAASDNVDPALQAAAEKFYSGDSCTSRNRQDEK